MNKRVFACVAITAFALLGADTFQETLRAARDKQDLNALNAAIADAVKTANNPDGQYRAALAYSYAAEVAMELHDKRKSASLAESGLNYARQASQAQPNNAEYHRLVGDLCGQVIPANPLFGGMKYGQCANDEINRALQLDPKSAMAYVSRGVGNYYKPAFAGGSPDQAVQDFDKAIALDPNLAEAYLWKGLALHKQNRDADARAAIEKAIALEPQRLWAKQELDKIPAK